MEIDSSHPYTLIENIRNEKHATLYKDLWGDTTYTHLMDVPQLHWKDLVMCPFKKRLYRDDNHFVHIAYKDDEACLIARTTKDIVHELYGDTSKKRPLVAFHYRHHTIEKSEWFYEHNLLPLPAIDDLHAAVEIARMYEVDTLTCDTRSLMQLQTHLHKLPLTSVYVVDTFFDEEVIKNISSKYEIRLILALPETGTLAVSCPENTPGSYFHPHHSTILEYGKSLIATRNVLLPTPIIRYNTGIPTQKIQESICSCNSKETFTLHA